MLRTSLYNKHVALKAKMVEFAGYEMPLKYSGVVEEHTAVRNSVGVFDVSHMGQFIIEGPQALNLLQRVSSNDISTLSIGQAKYTCFPNNNGGIVDDLIIYRLDSEKYMLVVNAANIEKDWLWINNHNNMQAVMSNISSDISLIAVQGPLATAHLQKLVSIDLSAIKFYTFVKGSIGLVDNVIISATGYTGSGGFELYVDNRDAPQLWDALFDVDSEIAIIPCGLGARDTLRLEMGYCLYGNDIDDSTSPLEAGLGWITKFNHDFVNSDQLRNQKEQGVSRKLVGIEMITKGIPRQGYDIYNDNQQLVGQVTSGTHSPMLNKGIALGYINKPYNKVGTELYIQIRRNKQKARVTKLPIVKLI